MRLFKRLFSRFFIVALTIVVLVLAIWFLIAFSAFALEGVIVHYAPQAKLYVDLAILLTFYIVSAIFVLRVANRDLVPETKIPWILCIVWLNLFGVVVYALFSSNRPSRKKRELYRAVDENIRKYEQKDLTREQLDETMGRWAMVSEALSTVSQGAIVRSGTKTEYLPLGEIFMERLLADLEKAEKYIFMEYFIIERGTFWNAVLSVLERKIREGVEVRVMYDDIGCMGKIHLNYHRTLKRKGIYCKKFSPFVPVLTNVHNNRDHRKIVVIDGKVGYTGGLNLADEYINAVHPFGHWKDSAVRLEGEGVKGLLFLFLRQFDVQVKQMDDVEQYLPARYENFGPEEGFVQPYGDGPAPIYPRHLSEDVYINILSNARKYVWIMTPYLIIDYRMREALILAAERGVDVRILTPHIPDKKIAFALTRSNYMALMNGGVKIYEYTPGFVHAKTMIADGTVATVGTVNLDYRSFLYHYEDGVFMYCTKAVEEIRRDFEETFAVSALQTEEDAKRSVVWRWICEIAKLFAPLF